MDKSMSVPELVQEINKAKTRQELELLKDYIIDSNHGTFIKKISLSMIIDKAINIYFQDLNDKARDIYFENLENKVKEVNNETN